MAANRSRRLLKPLLYASGAAAAGGVGLYVVYRPRNIPGLDPAAVPPPTYGAEGVLLPPNFPKIKNRDEQIADLKRSSGIVSKVKGATVRGVTDSIKGLLDTRKDTPSGASAQAEEDPYDLLIIGAGATGSGIALDAATRGLRVAVVERDDFSSGTSSKSTKLVHGGVRYLEKAVWELDYNQ
jgi:glycerol-3-phosphate dehydrogenase